MEGRTRTDITTGPPAAEGWNGTMPGGSGRAVAGGGGAVAMAVLSGFLRACELWLVVVKGCLRVQKKGSKIKNLETSRFLRFLSSPLIVQLDKLIRNGAGSEHAQVGEEEGDVSRRGVVDGLLEDVHLAVLALRFGVGRVELVAALDVVVHKAQVAGRALDEVVLIQRELAHKLVALHKDVKGLLQGFCDDGHLVRANLQETKQNKKITMQCQYKNAVPG